MMTRMIMEMDKMILDLSEKIVSRQAKNKNETSFE
jgi:hypothetical protein